MIDILWSIAAIVLTCIIATIITFEVNQGARLTRALWSRFRLWLARRLHGCR